MLQKETNAIFYRNREKGYLALFETDNDFGRTVSSSDGSSSV